MRSKECKDCRGLGAELFVFGAFDHVVARSMGTILAQVALRYDILLLPAQRLLFLLTPTHSLAYRSRALQHFGLVL